MKQKTQEQTPPKFKANMTEEEFHETFKRISGEALIAAQLYQMYTGEDIKELRHIADEAFRRTADLISIQQYLINDYETKLKAMGLLK